MAYEQKKIPLHAYIWVRFNGSVEDESQLIKSTTLEDKSVVNIFSNRLIRKDPQNQLMVQYILTTPGRILLNKVLQDSLTFST
jgi:DNA-directed RNA polymerase subunit beta'